MKKVQKVNQQSSHRKQEWNKLTDVQKQQKLLQSTRLLDHETFIKQFKSWEQPDAELIEDYNSNNNEQAFDELYRRHKSGMLAYLYGILHSWEDAKDVLHNAWEAVLHSFSNRRYREEQDFAGWFKGICYHRASEWKREKRRFIYGSGQQPDHADASFNAEERLENRQREILLHKAMSLLTDTEKQIVILRIYEEMNFYEIAVMRHITASAVRGIYCRALKKMKQAII